MKSVIWVVLLVALFSTSGCLTSAPYWARRAIVHDDVVYVKSNKTLYRRYNPKGVRLPGNKALLDIEKEITAGNKNIIVFSNLKKAKESGLEYKLGPVLQRMEKDSSVTPIEEANP